MDRGFQKPHEPRRLQGLTRGLSSLFFLIGIISGCGQSQSSSGAAQSISSDAALIGKKTNSTWLTGCPSCSLLRQPITAIRYLHSVSADRSALMSFSLVVDANVAEIDFTDVRVVGRYYGRATLLGRWRVNQMNEQQLCGAPVGEYIVRPLTPSYITSGTLSGRD